MCDGGGGSSMTSLKMVRVFSASATTMNRLEPRDSTTAVTSLRFPPSSFRSISPVTTSHTTMVLSSLPDRTNCASGVATRHRTMSAWPRSSRS